MRDYGKYIGAEFEDRGRGPAYDCWGLVKVALAEQFGIQIPDLSAEYESATDHRAIPGIVERERSSWKRVEDPTEGDVILLLIKRRHFHVGLCIGGGQMLHIFKGINACRERYGSPLWAPRIQDFYRYRE